MTDKIVDREKVSPTNVVNLPDSIAPEDFPEVLEQTMVNFANGDIIEGTVVSVTRNEIMVDVGYKSEGVIPSRELSAQKDKDARSTAPTNTTKSQLEIILITKDAERWSLR